MSNDLVPKSVAERMDKWRLNAKMWTPWPYQARALKAILENGQYGLLLSPGMGKTSIVLAAIKVLLKKKLIKRALITAPLRACYDTWPAEVCAWKDFSNLNVALLHDSGKEKVLRALQPEHQIVLINPEGFQWLTGNKQRIKMLSADMLVVDECFVAGTSVTTPNGSVPIENLRAGDYVLNEAGRCIINRCTSRPPRGGLVEIKFNGLAKTIRCTEDHPFFTELGWLPAKCLAGRRALRLDTLRNLFQEDKTISQVVEQGGRKDLLAILRAEVGGTEEPKFRRTDKQRTAGSPEESVGRQESEHFRAPSKVAHTYTTRAMALCYCQMRSMRQYLQGWYKSTVEWVSAYLLKILRHKTCLATRQWIQKIICSNDLCKDVYGSTGMEQGYTMVGGIQRQSVKMGEGQRTHLEGTWREWERTFACGDSGFRVSAEEVYLQLCSRVGQEAAWLSYQLQSRLWRPNKKAGNRSRRNEPRAAQSSGLEEGSEAAGTRVESVSYLEPRSIPLVYNLEVEGCPHFEVEGCAVVHNSSLWKSGTSVRFRCLRKNLQEFKRRVILTGSPCPRHYLDLWAQMYILDRGVSLGQYISHYRNQFFFPTGYKGYDWQILPGSEEKINALVAPFVLRLDSADYLKLPKVMEREHRVVLPEKARKEYDSIEENLMSTLFTAPLTSSAAARSKCCQIANGAVYVDAGPQDERWPSKIRPVKVVHTAKVEALVDLYRELQGEPLLCGIGYRHDVDAIRKALGEDVPCINGETTRTQAADYIDQWNSGKLDLLLGHPSSMGYALNLQKFNARHVGFFDIPENYDTYSQFFLRVCRQGNKSTFVMRHLFVTENTVDVAKVRNLRKKGAGQQSFLDAMREYANERGYKVPKR